MKTSIATLLSSILLFYATEVVAQFETYDYPGADHTYVTGMNDIGDYVGYYINGSDTKGFYMISGQLGELDYPGSQQTYALGINNEREIVGKYNDTGAQADNEGFKYDYNAQDYEDLTFLLNNGDYTQVTDINDDGCWTGSFRSPTSAYLMRDCNGHQTDRVNLLATFGTAINEWGDVAGYYIDGAAYTSFLRTGPGLFQEISYPGNIKTRIYGINDLDMVVGDFANARGFLYDGFSQGGSGYEEIILPDAVTVTPQDINNENQICGYYTDSDGNTHGFFILAYDIGFRPQPDAWQFENTQGNLWPSSDWFNTVYLNDPYLMEAFGLEVPFPRTGPGAFDFFGSETFPSWPLMVKTFGQGQFYTVANGVIRRKEKEFEVWKKFASDFWKGSCYGMSYTALMYYKDGGAFSSKFPAIASPIQSVFSLTPIDGVRDAINQIQTYQAGVLFRDNLLSEENPFPNQTLQRIKAMMLEDDPNYFGLSLQRTTGGSGLHSVVPYKVEKGDNTGWWDVYVYDSNHPNDTTRRIRINKQSQAAGGTWYYEAAGNAGQGDVEWGGPAANWGLKVTLPVSDHFPVPDVTIGHGASERSVNQITVFFSDDSDELFINGNDSMGYYNGNMVYNTSINGVPYFSATNSPDKPTGYTLDPLTTYNGKVLNANGEASMVAVTTDALLGYERFDATTAQEDELIIGSGITFINPDSDDKTVTLKAFLDVQGVEYRYWINEVNCEQGAELHIEPVNENELIVTNTGAATSYDLTISILSETDASTFEVENVPFAQDGTHHIVPFWGSLVEDGIYITVDTLAAGVDDTLFLENQALPELALSEGLMQFNNQSNNGEFYIINSGGGQLGWDITTSPSWVNITSGTSGIDDGSVSLDVDANNGADRSGFIIIESNAASSPDTITVWQGLSTINVNETVSDQKPFVIYPNPASEELKIGLSGSIDNAVITIRDIKGRPVSRVTGNHSGNGTISIDLKALIAGMYVVEVRTSDQNFVEKFIKH